MSGSHFGSGFWPDDYFGLYFQPEAGGVVIGSLSGSFAGASSFSGTLEQQQALEPEGHGARYWRTVRKNREYKRRLRELYTEVRAADPPPVAEERIAAAAPALRGLPPADAIDWAAMAAETEQRLWAALEAATEAIEQDDEEIMLLLAA